MDLALRKRPPMHSNPGPCPPRWGQILLVYRDISVGGGFLFLFSFISRYLKARVLYCGGPCVTLLFHPGLLSAPLGPRGVSPVVAVLLRNHPSLLWEQPG